MILRCHVDQTVISTATPSGLRAVACWPPINRCYALTSSGVSGRINSQYLHKLCDLSQVTQRMARCFVVPAKDVHKEDVLPRMATQRARFDLTEIDIAQGKDAQRLEEYTRHILEGKTNRGLVGAFR